MIALMKWCVNDIKDSFLLRKTIKIEKYHKGTHLWLVFLSNLLMYKEVCFLTTNLFTERPFEKKVTFYRGSIPI